jgi:hypothetical protein
MISELRATENSNTVEYHVGTFASPFKLNLLRIIQDRLDCNCSRGSGIRVQAPDLCERLREMYLAVAFIETCIILSKFCSEDSV